MLAVLEDTLPKLWARKLLASVEPADAGAPLTSPPHFCARARIRMSELVTTAAVMTATHGRSLKRLLSTRLNRHCETRKRLAGSQSG